MSLQIATRGVTPEPVIVGNTPAIRELRSAAERVAQTTVPVLISGEPGAGKTLTARFIHARSPRAAGRFAVLNCKRFSEALLQAELFGEPAPQPVAGRHSMLRDANGGTLFLDGVGAMTARMQAMLLGWLDQADPDRHDPHGPRIDLRVLASTEGDLAALVKTGQFREDLMYRLKVVHLRLPPLRERREDVRALLRYMLMIRRSPVEFDESAVAALEGYRWPGNVTELERVIDGLIAAAGTGRIAAADLPPGIVRTRQLAGAGRTDRRKHVADHLLERLASGTTTFWEQVHPLFMNRDITRHDLRELVGRGLASSGGNYRALLPLFGIAPHEYKRFLEFLTKHGCNVDFRPFRAR